MKSKTLLICGLLIVSSIKLMAQPEIVVPVSNRSSSSLEKNILFFADQRYAVSQSGSTSLSTPAFFDGNYNPQYSSGINPSNPYVILIENLPDIHVQAGGWIGWTTRFWQPTKFKIEVYNSYGGANTWVTVADESSYGYYSYMAPVYSASVSKIRFTFYNTAGPDNALGLSELFFIHPEAAVAYDGLMVKYNSAGNVGIGTETPNAKLAVNGNIRAHEIKVETANWPDYVFTKDYQLPTLGETEKHIREKGHLPGIPSAAEVKTNGVDLGEMNVKLLQKIEELTLYLIEKDKQLNADRKMIFNQEERIKKLENKKRYTTIKPQNK